MEEQEKIIESIEKRDGRWYHPLDFNGFDSRDCAEADYKMSQEWGR